VFVDAGAAPYDFDKKNDVRFFADCAAKKGLLSEQHKSGLKDIGSVLPLTPEKCG
jgi:hypothetical protein